MFEALQMEKEVPFFKTSLETGIEFFCQFIKK